MSEPTTQQVVEMAQQLANAGLPATWDTARELLLASEIEIKPADPNLIPNPERHKMRPILHQREATPHPYNGETLRWPAPPPPPAENLGPWTGDTTPVATTATQAAQQVRHTGTPITILRSLYRQLETVIQMLDREGAAILRTRGVGDGEFVIGDFLITSRWHGRVGDPRTQETEAQREALYRADGMQAINAAAPYDYAALQETLARAADATMRPLNDPEPGTPF